MNLDICRRIILRRSKHSPLAGTVMRAIWMRSHRAKVSVAIILVITRELFRKRMAGLTMNVILIMKGDAGTRRGLCIRMMA